MAHSSLLRDNVGSCVARRIRPPDTVQETIRTLDPHLRQRVWTDISSLPPQTPTERTQNHPRTSRSRYSQISSTFNARETKNRYSLFPTISPPPPPPPLVPSLLPRLTSFTLGTIRSTGLGFTSAKKFGTPLRLRRTRSSLAAPSPVAQAKALLSSQQQQQQTPAPRSQPPSHATPIRSTKMGYTDAAVRVPDAQPGATALQSNHESRAEQGGGVDVVPQEEVHVGMIRSFKEGQTTASPMKDGRRGAQDGKKEGSGGEPVVGVADVASVGVIRSRSFGSTTASADTHRARQPFEPRGEDEPKTIALETGVIRAAEKGYSSATQRQRDELFFGSLTKKLSGALNDALLGSSSAGATASLGEKEKKGKRKYSCIRATTYGGTNASARLSSGRGVDNEDRVAAFRQRAQLSPTEGSTIYASGKKGYTTRSTRKHEAVDAEMVKDLITSRPQTQGWSPVTIRASSVKGRDTAASVASVAAHVPGARKPQKPYEYEFPDKPLVTRDTSVRVVGHRSDGKLSTPILAPSPRRRVSAGGKTPTPRTPAGETPTPAKQLDFEVSTTPSARKGIEASQRLFARGTTSSRARQSSGGPAGKGGGKGGGKSRRVVHLKSRPPRPRRRPNNP